MFKTVDSHKALLYIRGALFAVLVMGALAVYGAPVLTDGSERTLTVAFFDVGQGDATFIESPTGVQVLIDGGPDASVLRALSTEMGFFDRTIDVVIATHADSDHVGGLPDVFERYAVATVVLTENTGESTTADEFRTRAHEEGAALHLARSGTVYDLGGGALLTILFPDRDVALLESNASSIIARLEYGETEFLFTGDAPAAVEEYLVSVHGSALQSDVLKVGHHGSKTSTSELFLEAVAPTYAVISAGKDNRYGHPHADVLKTIADAGAQSLGTYEEGTLTFKSDGKNITYQK